MGNKHIHIGIFDADPIRLYAFNRVVLNNRSVQLSTFELDNDEAWTTHETPNLVMVNMDSRKCCANLLLHKVLGWVPAIPVVCYSLGKRSAPQVPRQDRSRITIVSYEESLRYLQEYVDQTGVQVLPKEYLSDDDAREQVDYTVMVGCLSPRELDIFCLVGKGNGPAEIADVFDCSISTVETHIKNLRGKLRLNGSVAMRRLAVEYMLSGHCHAISQQRSHICLGRNKTVGTCPFKALA